MDSKILIQKMETLLDVQIIHDWLENFVNEKKEIRKYKADEQMHGYLYENHEEIKDCFIRKNEINFDDEEQVLCILSSELEKIIGLDYEENKMLLVKIAAIYGCLIVEKIGWRWKYDNYVKNVEIDKIPCISSLDVLDNVIRFWELGLKDGIKDEYAQLYNTVVASCEGLKKRRGKEWKQTIQQSIYPLPKCELDEEEILEYIEVQKKISASRPKNILFKYS